MIRHRRGSPAYWTTLLTMPRDEALAELAAWEHALPDDVLVGVTEIAERAGVRPDTVHAWRARHATFPAPAEDLAMGPVWWWSDVAAWLAIPRRPGRPRITR